MSESRTPRNKELFDKIADARHRIGLMCSEGRPPAMSIPPRYEHDDDLIIVGALDTAKDRIEKLEQESNMLLEALKKAEFNLRKAAARHIADVKIFDLYLGEAEQAVAAIAAAEKARES